MTLVNKYADVCVPKDTKAALRMDGIVRNCIKAPLPFAAIRIFTIALVNATDVSLYFVAENKLDVYAKCMLQAQRDDLGTQRMRCARSVWICQDIKQRFPCDETILHGELLLRYDVHVACVDYNVTISKTLGYKRNALVREHHAALYHYAYRRCLVWFSHIVSMQSLRDCFDSYLPNIFIYSCPATLTSPYTVYEKCIVQFCHTYNVSLDLLVSREEDHANQISTST
jgi:hypothetical protein